MKTQNPWMGRARGSAGNMTSSKVYDKNVMRAKAFEVNNPKTAAQTNERNFFAEAQKVCQTVSEEQLHSLFGVKPKSKSRRNALLSQLLEAYSITNGVKDFDFSKLNSIGNGQKVKTPIYRFEDGIILDTTDIPMSDFGITSAGVANILLVVFNETKSSIELINCFNTIESVISIDGLIEESHVGQNGYVYPTCPTNLENVYNKAFGSFTIKTRAD